MKAAALEEQLNNLRDMGKSWVGIAAQGVFAIPALIVFYKALTLREYGLIPIGIGLSLFALIIYQGMPHVRRAVKGIDSNDRCRGTVKISIEESSENTYYKAEVSVYRRGGWEFPFRPQGWIAEEQELQVECRFIRGVEWPVLLVCEIGLIYPTGTPKPMRPDTLK